MPISPLDKPDNLQEEKIEALKDLFPHVFSDGKLNLEALKEELGDLIDELPSGEEHYGLNWPGKRDAKKLATKPPTGTLKPMPGEGVNEDTTKNLIIEGDNLEVLRIMQKAYAGRIKMIYIDPPYNTGNDFVYKDDFKEPVESYLRRSGQADEEGLLVANPKASGRFHSNWLNMMYPRLRLARNLLKEDGVIFVSIDDNEIFNLKNFMDEVFGEENFRGVISRATGTRMGSGNKKIASELDYILSYAKSDDFSLKALPMTKEDLKIYDQEDGNGRYLTRSLRRTGGENRREDRPTMFYAVEAPDGTAVYPIAPEGWESRWVCGQERYFDLLEQQQIEWKKFVEGDSEVWKVYQKHYLGDASKQTSNSWADIDGNKKGTREVNALFDGRKLFDYPKPVELLRRLVELSASSDDLVLDFFAGSGTTAQAVFELNKENVTKMNFILVQLPENTKENSEAFKAGYPNIAEISKERVRRAILKLQRKYVKESDSLGFCAYALAESNVRKWTDFEGADPQALGQLFETLETPFIDGWTPEGVLTEVMLTEGFPLDSEVSRAEAFTTEVQRIKHPELDLELLLCLEEKLDSSIVPLLAELDHTVFVCRESALSDEIKLQLADVITVKTL